MAAPLARAFGFLFQSTFVPLYLISFANYRFALIYELAHQNRPSPFPPFTRVKETKLRGRFTRLHNMSILEHGFVVNTYGTRAVRKYFHHPEALSKVFRVVGFSVQLCSSLFSLIRHDTRATCIPTALTKGFVQNTYLFEKLKISAKKIALS
jgi:hypothetical protein